MTTIITANGTTELVPVYCEVTNEQIAWRTEVPANCTPAYVSLDVVNDEGEVLLDATDISTF
jgi:hypothetical protein